MLVVASSFGTLGHLAPQVRPRFERARSLAGVEAVLADWRTAVHEGRAEAEGWPNWINVPSKVAQVAAVRAVAAERRDVPTARWSPRSARAWSTRTHRGRGSTT